MKGHPAPRRLRLALLDDHDIVRRGTVLHLSQDARFRIIASHGHSDAFIQTLQQTRVDVAVIDLTLARGDRSSTELIPLLRAAFPE
ncbi:hypothetical protein M3J50_25240, partial [Enterobacter hormaechei]|nr:hypothetical protein [Enterobacter hormaechei]